MPRWVGAVAHSNVALVKYWGKRDRELNLPAVGSLSVTLDALTTTTRVLPDEALTEDELVLDGRPASREQVERVRRFLELARRMAGKTTRLRVHSHNNFPTGAGLASSASGFAALALAASRALDLPTDARALSLLSRRGSGSAARSVLGGFVEWDVGVAADGMDCFAHSLAPQNHWDLRVLVAITAKGPKDVGSTAGMEHCSQTSAYFDAWVRTQEVDLSAAREAIAARDLASLGRVMERSTLKMHATMLAADPGLIYWNATTLETIHSVRAARARGLEVYFTIDAGPQVKLLCRPECVEDVRSLLASLPGVSQVLLSKIGGGVHALADDGEVS